MKISSWKSLKEPKPVCIVFFPLLLPPPPALVELQRLTSSFSKIVAGATGRHTEEEVRAEIQQVLIDRKIDPLFDRGLLICAQDALDGPLTLEEAVRLIEELEFESLLIDG